MEQKLFKMAVEGINIKDHVDIDLLKQHKLYATYLQLNKSEEIGGQTWEKFRVIEKGKKEELLKVISELNEKNINYLLLKGPSLQKYYPKSFHRYSLDYDFSIETLEGTRSCLEILFKLGFDYEFYPYFSFQKELRGVIKMIKPLGNDNSIAIELNIGGFPASDFTWIDYQLLSIEKEIIYESGIPISVPADNTNFIILLAEMNERDLLRVRDALDYKYLIKYVDLESVEAILKRLKLYKNINRLSRYLKKLEEGKNINYFFLPIKKKTNKLILEVSHIIPMIYNSHNRPFRDLCRNYYKRIGEYFLINERFENNIKTYERFLDVRERFYSGIMTHFVPIDSKRFDSWQWVSKDNIHLVKTPLGIYMASNYCIHSEEELEKVEEIIKKL